jgi:ribbon-helix-helix CopG family protein
MRVTIRLDGALAEQVAAARAERGIEMAAMVREALTAYLASPTTELPSPPECTPAAQGAPTLDACVATLLRHWPPEIQTRLTAEMAWTGLSAREYLLGICYAWATRR